MNKTLTLKESCDTVFAESNYSNIRSQIDFNFIDHLIQIIIRSMDCTYSKASFHSIASYDFVFRGSPLVSFSFKLNKANNIRFMTKKLSLLFRYSIEERCKCFIVIDNDYHLVICLNPFSPSAYAYDLGIFNENLKKAIINTEGTIVERLEAFLKIYSKTLYYRLYNYLKTKKEKQKLAYKNFRADCQNGIGFPDNDMKRRQKLDLMKQVEEICYSPEFGCDYVNEIDYHNLIRMVNVFKNIDEKITIPVVPKEDDKPSIDCKNPKYFKYCKLIMEKEFFRVSKDS